MLESSWPKPPPKKYTYSISFYKHTWIFIYSCSLHACVRRGAEDDVGTDGRPESKFRRRPESYIPVMIFFIDCAIFLLWGLCACNALKKYLGGLEKLWNFRPSHGGMYVYVYVYIYIWHHIYICIPAQLCRPFTKKRAHAANSNQQRAKSKYQIPIANCK